MKGGKGKQTNGRLQKKKKEKKTWRADFSPGGLPVCEPNWPKVWQSNDVVGDTRNSSIGALC